MAGYMYLGQNKVSPSILAGEKQVLPLFDINDGVLEWKKVIDGSGIKYFTSDFVNTFTQTSYFAKGVFEEVYFPDLEVLEENTGYQLFNKCANLKIVSMPKLKEIKAFGLRNGFIDTTNLQTLEFPSLETVGEQGMLSALGNCGVTSLSFPKLKSVGINALAICFYGSRSKLESITFGALDFIGEGGLFWGFSGNKSIKTITFNSLKSTSFAANDVFEDMLSSTTGCTVHFPSNLQSVIGGWSDVVGGFGGTNTTILFDLPATE